MTQNHDSISYRTGGAGCLNVYAVRDLGCTVVAVCPDTTTAWKIAEALNAAVDREERTARSDGMAALKLLAGAEKRDKFNDREEACAAPELV